MLKTMRWVPATLLATTALLAGCGGSNSSSTTNVAPTAFSEQGQADFSGVFPNRNTVASANTLASPTGSIATNGALFYVADTNNNRVLVYRSPPALNGAAADFVIGQPDLATTAPGVGTATVLGLSHPSKVAIAGNRLVITDSGNNRVLIWNALPTTAGTSFTTPPDVVVGQADKVSKVAATSQTGLNNPTGAMIAANMLIVADRNNNRVLVWNTIPTTNGAPASLVLGEPDFVTATAQFAAANTLANPVDVWSDGYYLLVSDSGNNRVLYWNQFPNSNGANANFVLGQSSFTSSTSSLGGAAAMRTPSGVYSDGQRVFVADAGNSRVLVFNNFPIFNGASAYTAYGQGDLLHYTANDDDQNNTSDVNSSGQSIATARTLATPTGVYAANGVVYVSDTFNNRLMQFSY